MLGRPDRSGNAFRDKPGYDESEVGGFPDSQTVKPGLPKFRFLPEIRHS
jgi:hypothetical protein